MNESAGTQGSAKRGQSPWGIGRRLQLVLWSVAWFLFCRWLPKEPRGWRNAVLRLFGARVGARSAIHSRTRINQPWNLTIGRRVAVGDGAVLYALGPIEIGDFAVVAQEAYLCTGTHDMSRFDMPLITKRIRVGAHAFIGARAFVLPGVDIGEGAVVGACSVVTKNVDPWTIVAGNPARKIGERKQIEGVAP